MGRIWAAGFLLRRLRAEIGVVALLVALLIVTSFLFAGAPRLFNLAADAALVHHLDLASAVDRDVELTAISFPPTGPSSLPAVDEFGSAELQSFPDSIRNLISQGHFSVTTPRFSIAGFHGFLSPRYQDGLESAIQVIAGRLPHATGDQLPHSRASRDQPPVEPGPPARIEIALSEATADQIHAGVGFSLTGMLDPGDPMLQGVVVRLVQAEFQVVGIFAVTDPAAEIWFGDHRLRQADVDSNDINPITFATALIGADAYPDLVAADLPVQLSWRYFVAPARLDVPQLATLLDDLKRLPTQIRDASFGEPARDALTLHTGLQRVIGTYLAERSVTEAVLSVAGIGPFALATGAIGMVAILLVLRRRGALELARSRGASGWLIIAAQLWEAVLLAGGAILIGLLLAVQFLPGRESSLSPALAVGTGLGAVLALVAATLPMARRRLGVTRRDDAAILPTSPRRLVLELTAVFLAVAGVLLLRQRGLVIGELRGGEIVRLDPFLAAVPVLASLAVGLIALRLYPLPIRGFGWLAARRRDLVPVLGMRKVGRRGASANLPLLVLLLTAAFATFASVLLASIEHGMVNVAWSEVGADYRIELSGLGDAGLDPGIVEGVESVAPAYVDPAVTFADAPGRYTFLTLMAVDLDAYLPVTAGTPIAIRWPPGLSTVSDPATTLGTPEQPIPAIVSRRLPPGSGLLSLGSTFTVRVGGRDLACVVIERRGAFPGVQAETPFVVLSLEVLQAARSAAPPPPNVLLIRGGAGAEAGLAAALRDRSPTSTLVSRYGRYAQMRAAPLVAMLTGGFQIALLAAVAYAALAIIGALALSAPRRRQDLAFLRTLGLNTRQALGLTVLEHGPPVLLALVPGVALGIWIATLLTPGLGLGVFIGSTDAVDIQVAWSEIALIGAALGLTVTIGVAATIRLAPRAQAVDALRLGGD